MSVEEIWAAVRFVNENSGAAMVLLTFVYVAATLLIVRAMHKANQLAVRLEQRRSRPYLLCDIEFRQGMPYLTIMNAGVSAALEVTLTLEPEPQVFRDSARRPSALLRHPIAMMTPGRKLEDLLEPPPGFFTLYPDPKFTGRLKYHDAGGITYDEAVSIDLNYYLGVGHVRDKTLADIVQELERIRKAFERGVSVLERTGGPSPEIGREG